MDDNLKKNVSLWTAFVQNLFDIWFEYIIPNSIFHVYILNKKLLPHARLDKTIIGDYYVTICM